MKTCLSTINRDYISVNEVMIITNINKAESLMGKENFINFVLAKDINVRNGLFDALENGQNFNTYCSIFYLEQNCRLNLSKISSPPETLCRGLNCLHHACMRVNSEKLKNFCEILRKTLNETSDFKELLTSCTGNNVSTVMSAACNKVEPVFISFMHLNEEVFHDDSVLDRLLLKWDKKEQTAFHRALRNNKQAFIAVINYNQLKVNETSLKKLLLTDFE